MAEDPAPIALSSGGLILLPQGLPRDLGDRPTSPVTQMISMSYLVLVLPDKARNGYPHSMKPSVKKGWNATCPFRYAPIRSNESYSCLPDSIQRRKTSTFASGHAPSQGIDPLVNRWRMPSACATTS